MAREQCAPSEADWYMEVVYGRDIPGGTETDYNYGYYKGAKPTKPSDLVPAGFKVLESSVKRTGKR